MLKTWHIIALAASFGLLLSVIAMPRKAKGADDCDRYSFLCNVNTNIKPLGVLDGNGNSARARFPFQQGKSDRRVTGRNATVQDAREPLAIPFQPIVVKTVVYIPPLPAVPVIPVVKASLPFLSQRTIYLDMFLAIVGTFILVAGFYRIIIHRRLNNVRRTSPRRTPFPLRYVSGSSEHGEPLGQDYSGQRSEPLLTASRELQSQASDLGRGRHDQDIRPVVARYETNTPLGSWARRLRAENATKVAESFRRSSGKGHFEHTSRAKWP